MVDYDSIQSWLNDNSTFVPGNLERLIYLFLLIYVVFGGSSGWIGMSWGCTFYVYLICLFCMVADGIVFTVKYGRWSPHVTTDKRGALIFYAGAPGGGGQSVQ
jgi:hypothetical protein